MSKNKCLALGDVIYSALLSYSLCILSVYQFFVFFSSIVFSHLRRWGWKATVPVGLKPEGSFFQN